MFLKFRVEIKLYSSVGTNFNNKNYSFTLMEPVKHSIEFQSDIPVTSLLAFILLSKYHVNIPSDYLDSWEVLDISKTSRTRIFP